MRKRHYHPGARFDLIYADETPFGSAVSGRCDREIRQRASRVAEHRRDHGMAATVRGSRELLGALFDADGALGALYEKPGVLREACLYPDPKRVRPVGLSVSGPDGRVVEQVQLDPGVMGDLAGWIGGFVAGEPAPRTPKVADLYAALDRLTLVDEAPPERLAPADGDLLFIGHAAARVGRRDAALIDPFLFPRSERYPSTYQPLTPVDLMPVAAIFITHSHPDHYDPASLLGFGADAPIHVPAVARESLLAIDMAARLRELGFRAVKPISPGDRVELGATRVDVLPFYGEQPTVGPRLHPEARNQGATYLMRDGGGHTFYFAVDSGRDADGDVRDLALDLRQRHGAPDVLLGGHRGFGLYPIHYLFSSVSRYLLFVPPALWAARQAIMNDAHELIDTAEIAGARLTIPYAAGGAPWHWEMGLGPRLDGHGHDNPFVDPPPEGVVAAARQRSASPEGPIASSTTSAIVLRPGEALSLAAGGDYAISAGASQKWPF